MEHGDEPPALVSTTWLAAHLRNPLVRIVDVRWYLDGRKGTEAYRAGHLPGALHLDVDADLSAPPGPQAPGRHPLPSPAAFADVLARAGIGPSTRVIGYDDEGGSRAARLWWMLRYYGHGLGSVLDNTLVLYLSEVARGNHTFDNMPIVLFGTGIIFGAMLQETGLAETMGESAFEALGISSAVTITAFAIVLAILVSETTSNTASAAVVVPIVLALAVSADVNPFVPALAATFAASFGFMLPVSTPQNAIVYGSGIVTITKMVRSGASFDVLGAILILLLLPLMVPLVGLGG